jgi:hypothetical protein
MGTETEFISPTGTIKHDCGKVYNFVADIRNFSRFVPADSVTNWIADADSCSFEVSPVGEANIRIVERKQPTVVKFGGVALQNTAFRVWVQLKEVGLSETKFRIVIKADLNQFYKLLAAKPVNNFLERLVDQIEKFEGWDEITKDTQSP